MARKKFAEDFAGLPPGLRMELQQALHFVRLGRVAPQEERDFQQAFQNFLQKLYKHEFARHIQARYLRYIFQHLGSKAVLDLAAQHQSEYLFRAAVTRTLLKAHHGV